MIPKPPMISARGMETAVVCPKCAYVRRASDSAPAWQCPSCGIAYAKFAAAKAATRSLVVPPKAGEAAPPALVDGSLWLLIAVNVFALAVAHHQRWPLTQLMLLYWGQSIVIGASYVLRILALEKFSTEGFSINDRPVDPTPATKRQVAGFFIFHFGFFHAIYLVFLLAVPGHGAGALQAGFWLCTAAFAANHFWSYRYNREVDRQGTPNIGTLMFTPYARIVPMHLTICTGAFLGKSLLLFGALKIIADVLMHLAEHAQLQKGKKA